MATCINPIPYSVEELQKLLILDAENGVLVRRVKPRGFPAKESIAVRYKRIAINGKQYVQHRIVWMLANRQAIPSGMQIDHINRDTHDNRPSNLRLVTASQNKFNSGRMKNNSTGYKGVYRREERYLALITVNRRTTNLGCFNTAEDAARAYDRAALELHGEFAVTNAQLGLLPLPATLAPPVQAPAPISMQLVPAQAPASRSYPGVPDLPPAMQRIVPCAIPAWTRPALHQPAPALY